MSSQVQRLHKLGLLPPGIPHFLTSNLMMEVIMGSYAYGVSNDLSDTDLYGFCIPEKEMIFPHLRGEIFGFGTPGTRFNNFQIHHVKDASTGRTYDMDIYGIVRYFDLCMDNNPNMLDSLFVPQRCVLHITAVGQMVREQRKMFLHKGAFHRLKGYAYSQLDKVDKEMPQTVKDVRDFESTYQINKLTTLNNVEEELRRRGLIDAESNKVQAQS